MSKIRKMLGLVAASCVLVLETVVEEHLHASPPATKDPIAKVVVNVMSAQEQGRERRLMYGAPLSIEVSVVPVLYPKVCQARKLLEEENRRYKAAGLTEDQIQGLMARHGPTKELAALKVGPFDLGKGWQQRVRFDITRQGWRKTKVLTKVEWKRYLHLRRYDTKQHVLTEEPVVAQWLVPPQVARAMTPGSYELKAVVGKITSSPLQVLVQEPRGREQQTDLALRLCSFYTETGNPDEAIRVGLRFLPFVRVALLHSVHFRLGEAYRAKGD